MYICLWLLRSWRLIGKGRRSKRNAMIKEVIREVAGFCPYERRMLELIKIGSSSTFKRALKLAKKRLGISTQYVPNLKGAF